MKLLSLEAYLVKMKFAGGVMKQIESDNFIHWEDFPCEDCDQKLDLMAEEYDKYGTHYFNEHSFCCSSAWQQLIPLEELR